MLSDEYSVLLIDDDADVLDAYTLLLEQERFQYTLVKVLKGKEYDQEMPHELFRWLSSNTTVGSMDLRLGVFDSHEHSTRASTRVRVYDRLFEMDEIHGVVHVVNPHHIHIRLRQRTHKNRHRMPPHLLPHRNKVGNVIKDHTYDVDLKVFDKDNHEIYVTSNIHFEWKIVEGHSQLSRRQASHVDEDVVDVLKMGQFVLHATMKTDAGVELETAQIFVVFDPVAIEFPVDQAIHLPIEVDVQQEYYATATGGSSALHRWFVLDSSVVDPLKDSSSGGRGRKKAPAVFLSRSLGKTYVVVFDWENYDNWDEREVTVSSPHHLAFPPGIREQHVGADLCVQLDLMNARGDIFANYSRLPPKFIASSDLSSGSEQKKVYRAPSTNKKLHSTYTSECVTRYDIFPFYAIQEGRATLMAQYKQMNDRIEVAAYEPYQVSFPSFVQTNDIVVSLGVIQSLLFTGGPFEWSDFGPKSKLSSFVTLQNTAVAVLETLEDRRSYRVTCLDFGRQVLEFHVINDINDPRTLQTHCILRKVFSCQPAAGIRLVPQHPLIGREFQPFSIDPIARYTVRNNQTVEVELRVFSPMGNVFVNYSTLYSDIEMVESKEALGKWVPSPVEEFWYRWILFDETEIGLMGVEGNLTGYKIQEIISDVPNVNALAIPEEFDVLYTEIEMDITSGVQLRMYCALSLTEESLWYSNSTVRPQRVERSNNCSVVAGFYCGSFEPYSVRRRRWNEENVFLIFWAFDGGRETKGDITGGSGGFDVTLSNENTVSLEYDEMKNEIAIRPISEGRVKVRAIDLQFLGSYAEITVKVADIDGVRVDGSHFLEMDSSITIQITPFDDERLEFDGSIFKQYDLMYEVRIDASKAVGSENEEKNAHLINILDCGGRNGRYQLMGLREGVVGLIASVVNRNGRRVYSVPFLVHVYPPFVIEPEELWLIPGSIYQIRAVGGPQSHDVVRSLTTELEIVEQVGWPSENDTSEEIPQNTLVATINGRGLIVAHEYGRARVILRKVWDGEVLVELSAPIRVVSVNGVYQIPPSDTTLYLDTTVPMHTYGVAIAEDDATLGVLTPLSLQSPYWSVTYENTNRKVVALLGNNVASSLVPVSAVRSTERLLVGEIRQFTILEVVASFSGHGEYQDYKFAENASLLVRLPLSILHLSCPPQALIMPPDSWFAILTNLNASEEIITFSASGSELLSFACSEEPKEEEGEECENMNLLVSGAEEGHSSFSIKDSISTLIQHVQIVTPAYIDLEDNLVQYHMQLGQFLEKRILLRTTEGRLFSTTNGVSSGIRIRSNDFAIVQTHLLLTEPTEHGEEPAARISFFANGSGKAVVEFYSPAVLYASYVIFVVHPTILPLRKDLPFVYIGEEVHFTAIGCVQNETFSKWRSKRSNRASISSISGVAVARKEGKTEIIYDSQASGETVYELHIRRLSSVRLMGSKGKTRRVSNFDLRLQQRVLSTVKVEYSIFDSRGSILNLEERQRRSAYLRNDFIIETLSMEADVVVTGTIVSAGDSTRFIASLELANTFGMSRKIHLKTRVWMRSRTEKVEVKLPALEIIILVDDTMLDKDGHYMPEKVVEATKGAAGISIWAQIAVAVLTILTSLFFYQFFLYRFFK